MTTVWVSGTDHRGDVAAAVSSLLRMGTTVEVKRKGGDETPDVVVTPAPCACCVRVTAWHRIGCTAVVMRDRMPDDRPRLPDPDGELDTEIELLDGSIEVLRALVPTSSAAVAAAMLAQGDRLPRRLRAITTEA